MRHIETLDQLGVPLLIAKKEHIDRVILDATIGTESVYIPGLNVRGGAETFPQALRECKGAIDAATFYIVEHDGVGMPGDLERLPLAKTVRSSLDLGNRLFLRFACLVDYADTSCLNWRTEEQFTTDWKI